MTSYFLSYSRADEARALRLADDLIAAGIRLWVDQYDIRPSQHWDRAVEAAVHACAGMIVVLSPRSAESPNVADEISVAIDHKKRVIPVMIETCTVPLRMTRMQFIDATTDYPRALRKCLAEIARDESPSASAVRESATPPLDPATVETATRRLTGVMGPIAGVLVKAAASRARNEADLYAELAAKLATPADRDAFLAFATAVTLPVTESAPASTPEPEALVAARDVARIARALARSLGPIAPRLVDREQRAAVSTADLCRRLAALVPNDHERAAFLKEVERL